MRYIVLILTGLLCSSCSFFLKRMAGIKDPRLETTITLNKYASTLGLDSTEVVFARDLSAMKELNRMFSGMPELLVFDNMKKHLPYKPDSTTCNAPIDLVLMNICEHDHTIASKRQVSLDQLMNQLYDPNKALADFELKDVDFLVIMNYVSYTEKLNKGHIIPWKEIMRKHPQHCRVKYLFVDLDYLNTWGIRQKDIPRIKVRS